MTATPKACRIRAQQDQVTETPSPSEDMAPLSPSEPTAKQDRTTGAQPDVFPFFRLPRELRDNIYVAVPLECKNSADGRIPITALCSVKIVAKTLKVNLLLVSKQFCEEYTKEMQARTSLIIHDLRFLKLHVREWQLPRVLKTISNVEISLMLAFYYVFPELVTEKSWVANVLSQLPNTATLRIRGRLGRTGYLGREQKIKQLGLASGREFWLSFPRLSDLKVYREPVSTLDIDYADPLWCETLLLEILSQGEGVMTVEQQE